MTLIRALAGVAIVGALALIATVILAPDDWGPPGTESYRVYELANRIMGIAFAAMAAAPVALRLSLVSASLGRAARIGLWLATIGAVGMALGSIAEFWVFSDAPYQGAASIGRNLAWLTFLVSGVLLLTGSVVTGIRLSRDRAMPRWVGWTVLLAGPAGIVAAIAGASFLISAALVALAMCAGALARSAVRPLDATRAMAAR